MLNFNKEKNISTNKTNDSKIVNNTLNPEKKFNLFGFGLCSLKPLSSIFNIMIFILIIALFIIISKELYYLFAEQLWVADTKEIMSVILFIFILVELFTILLAYLKTEFVKVERILEVGIIAIVRDIFIYATEFDSAKLYGLSTVLFVFGILFFIEKYFSKERNKC